MAIIEQDLPGAKPSLIRATLSHIASHRRELLLTLLRASLLVLALVLCQNLLLTALGYLVYAFNPRWVAAGLQSWDSSGMPTGPGWLTLFAVFYMLSSTLLSWQAVVTAVFARKIKAPDNPQIQRLPLLALMGLSLAMAMIQALGSLMIAQFRSEYVMLGPLLASALFLLVQPLLSNYILFKVPARVLTGESLWSPARFGRSKAREPVGPVRQIWLLNIFCHLLVGLVVFGQVFIAQMREASPVLILAVEAVSLLLWLGVSLVLGVASVKEFESVSAAETPAAAPAAAPNWLMLGGLAGVSLLLAGVSLLLIGGAYAYQLGELARLEQEWQGLKQASLARLSYHRPVLRGQALAGNGAPVYATLVGKPDGKILFEVAKADKDAIENYRSEAFEGRADKLAIPDFAGKYAPQIQILKTAMQHESFDFGARFTADEDLPNFTTTQDMARIMSLSAAARIRRGECRQGLEQTLDALRLGQDLGSHWSVISRMSGIANTDMTLRTVETRIRPDCLSPTEFRQVLGEFAKFYQARQGYTPQIFNEYNLEMQTFLDIARKGDAGAYDWTVTSDQRTAGPLAGMTQIAMLPQYLDGYRLAKQNQARLEQATVQNYLQAKAVLKETPEQTKEVMGNWLMNLIQLNTSGVLSRMAYDEARVAGYYQYLALQAYYRDQGHYPPALQALVPALLPQLPLDPFTGKAFVYKRLNDKDFRLYSIGGDGVDNGGQGVYFRKPCLEGAYPDLVFAPGQPKSNCEY
ncbi:MAG: hypothetical protein ACAI44_32720 [Candidatus Sericytochromatia bacterium]